MKRLLCILLLASMLLMTVACGKTSDTADTTTAATTAPNVSDTAQTTPPAETEPPETGIASRLTEEQIEELGLEGYTVEVFMRYGWDNRDIWVEDLNGEVLNDAVYNRNLALEEEYGFTYRISYSTDTEANELRTYALSQDDTFDLAFPMARTAATVAQMGGLADMMQLEYIDPESDVWNHIFNNEMVFDGRLYFITGDISCNAFEATRAMLFNKELLAEFNLESPYELVKNYKWTIDKLNELAKTATRNLDGNQSWTIADQYGMTMQSATAGLPMFYGAGLQAVRMVDGLPQFALDNSHASDVFDKILNTLSDESVYYVGADKDALSVFSEGRALFYAEVLRTTETLRSSEVEFGLIPAPMYNEEQGYYRAYADTYCVTPAVIPACAKNPELSAFVLQVTSEASTDTTRVAYYDVMLTYHQLRDEESSEMLDLIFDNFTLDPCDLYEWTGILTTIRNSFNRSGGSTSLSSLLGSMQKVVEKMMDQTVKKYESLP